MLRRWPLGTLLVKHCIEVCDCFYLESRIRLIPFSLHCTYSVNDLREQRIPDQYHWTGSCIE
jgi:hypothetical protein